MHSWDQAEKHALTYERPAPNFFEGALLGNGGLGAVVTTRPDAVVVHFGHNNVWDIRIAENHGEELGDFRSLFARLKEIPAEYESLSEDAWYRDYVRMAGENYARPYPRPMPCGSLLLGFDRRTTEVLGHTLHIHNGLCEVHFLTEGRKATLLLFADQREDLLYAAWKDPESPAALTRVKLIPDPETPEELPPCLAAADAEGGQLSFRQTLPRSEEGREGDPRDKAFRLTARLSSSLREGTGPLETAIGPENVLPLAVRLEEGPESEVAAPEELIEPPGRSGIERSFDASQEAWRSYWSRSGVALADDFLERIWYRNLYFFNCAAKPEATCPGLFANWSYGRIGADWHGDYHMNYNTQQPFWLAFSSNHLEKHLAYVNMVDHVLPVSRSWAKDYYGLRGAYFPHSAYPVEMSMMPYPVPHWGWEVCETPWTVQSLWWHYLYSMDRDFLQNRAFGPIREAVLFMVDYMKRPEASGEARGDGLYHIFPTVVPELYELTPGFRRNKDCIVDLTLTKFLFGAFERACAELELKEKERELLAEVREIREKFPDYPTAGSKRGRVFVSVEGEDPETLYNVPNGISTVFPGEDHGLHSSPDEYATAVNSYLNHRNEGGNELVFYHMAGARLGRLDLERFKRQIAYCMLPNGTCTDRLLEAGGRYSDTTGFDYMSGMGIWFENFALPAVVNECLLQSYNGFIRLFPNWPLEQEAEFSTLRAAGAFLVSGRAAGGAVQWVEVFSEAGSPLRMYNPWNGAAKAIRGGRETTLPAGAVIETDTDAGETIRFERA